MIETRNKYNMLLKIFCIKEPDCVMKIIASWMTFDDLEGARTRIYFIDSSGTKEMKQFTYRKPFGVNFRYTNRVVNYTNWRHEKFSLDRA